MTYQSSDGPCVHVKFYLHEGKITNTLLLPKRGGGTNWEIFSDFPCRRIEEKICLWMHDYCNNKQPTGDLPLFVQSLPGFTQRVLTTLLTIPVGGSLTYQDLAALVENPKAARAVGNACGCNPLPLIIPCHRVLAKGHRLGGYSLNLTIKKQLLRHEGISLPI